MKSLYDILGVKRDANGDELKKAFRRKSSTAHPDKGGSNEEMALVNRAYSVLGDPARRARYDETGDEAAEQPIEQGARQFILQAFAEALGQPQEVNSVEFARKKAEREKAAAGDAARNMERMAAKLRVRRAKVKVREGDNLMHALIDQQIAELTTRRAAAEQGIRLFDAALVALDVYESTEQPPQPAPSAYEQLYAQQANNNPFGFFR